MRKKYIDIIEEVLVRIKSLENEESRLKKFVEVLFEEKIVQSKKSIDEINQILEDAGITHLGVNRNLCVRLVAVPIAEQIEAVMKYLNVEFKNQPATEEKIIVKEVKK